MYHNTERDDSVLLRRFCPVLRVKLQALIYSHFLVSFLLFLRVAFRRAFG